MTSRIFLRAAPSGSCEEQYPCNVLHIRMIDSAVRFRTGPHILSFFHQGAAPFSNLFTCFRLNKMCFHFLDHCIGVVAFSPQGYSTACSFIARTEEAAKAS